MEAPRPVSANERASFESRRRSPLSISSTAAYNYESSRTSQGSAFSEIDPKTELVKSRTPLPPVFSVGEKRHGPDFRYGASGYIQQQETWERTLRMTMGPPSPNKAKFGARYSPRIPGETFKKLPEEILLVILGELKKSHLEMGSLSCATCLMRDLVNLGLSCKKWWSATKIVLYEDIILNGSDSIIHLKKKYKVVKYGTRLKLLRRTLRDRPELASYVKSLKVPSLPEAAKEKEDQEEYIDLVASLIMACPNLERLPGFYLDHNHTFSRFFHALATRTQLTENVWVISPSPYQRQRKYNIQVDFSQDLSPVLPSALLPEQYNDFLSYHLNWTHLKTLFFHCQPGGMVDSPLFTEVCGRLPSLENLSISSFPSVCFNDLTLISLPPLRRLRLDALPGITAAGLLSFVSQPSSTHLTCLSLIALPLVSLPALARLFSRLTSLTHFTLSQVPSPVLSAGEEIYLHPYLASSTLEYLHWETIKPSDDKAVDILSKSIFYGGFPSLRTIRAPTDFDGSLQKLCRPREKIELPGDRYRNYGPTGQSILPTNQSIANMPSQTRSVFSLGHSHANSTTSVSHSKRSSLSSNKDRPHSGESHATDHRVKGFSLATARRLAQHRIDAALMQPNFHIIVWGENGTFVERHKVGGFMGTVQSKVSYTLKPDIDGTDEAVVTVDGQGGLLDGGEETNLRDGCTGSWNRDLAGLGRSGKAIGGKENWWHTERGRRKEVKLEKFF
jgi:hypothetical protein